MSAEPAIERARAACAQAVIRLQRAEVPLEGLAEYVPAHRAMLIPRPATMRPLGRVWRIAPLLLGDGGELFAAGRITRAAERVRPNHQSLSREERRDIAAAALRGGYPPGAAVNYDAPRILLDEASLAEQDGPLRLSGGEARVLWQQGAALSTAPTLAQFLDERIALIIEMRA